MYSLNVSATNLRGPDMKTTLVILISFACIIFTGCMSQQSATKERTHEFTKELPNHPKAEVFERVVKWIANSSKSARAAPEYQDKEAGSIVSNGSTQISPESPRVSMPMGFTMSVDVKNEKMRIRFTNLRRLYGSKTVEQPFYDDFFKTPTAIPYQQAAQQTFASIVQDLTDFIERGKIAVQQEGSASLTNR
jgi:hypothetical protein